MIAGTILLLVGAICIGAGLFAGNMMGIAMADAPQVAQESMEFAQSIFTYSFVGVGGFLSFLGVISLIRGGRSSKITQKVLREGVEGQGTVTFIDRNYRVRVNGRPVYSIVEYSYMDSIGNQYVNRIDDANTEFVIRAGWQAGTKIPIKYLSEDPQKSAVIMP